MAETKWASVLDDLLDPIFRFFHVQFHLQIIEFLGFKSQKKWLRNHRLPWILSSSIDDRGKEKPSLYNSMTGAEIRNFELRIRYKHERCCCSSHGWLFFMYKELTLVVLNPISSVIIYLPPFLNVDF